MSAGTKADSEDTLVRPNQVNDQVNDCGFVIQRCQVTGSKSSRIDRPSVCANDLLGPVV